MQSLGFSKYSGCGNDFILMEMPDISIDLITAALTLCNRKEGIGADGLIILEPSEKADFKVHFYNADGSLAEMCGNGIRSAVHFFLNKKLYLDIKIPVFLPVSLLNINIIILILLFFLQQLKLPNQNFLYPIVLFHICKKLLDPRQPLK